MIVDGVKVARIAIPKKLLNVGVHEWSLFDVEQQWALIKRLAEASIKRWQLYPDNREEGGPEYEIRDSFGRLILLATNRSAMRAHDERALDIELPDHIASSGYTRNYPIETLIGWAELERRAQVFVRDLKKQGAA